MAKRFTDTDKYKKHFIRSLPGAYKLLWDYLYHDCNHAGVWIVDFDIAQIYLGSDMVVEKDKALNLFNKDEIRIIEFCSGKKWFIKPFIDFQYGELNPSNRAHNSVINILKKENIYKAYKGHISPLQGAKDKDMDKELGKEMDKDRKSPPNFSEVVEYFKEKGFSEGLARKFYTYYQEPMEDNGGRVWKDQNGKTVKSWKQKALGVWMKDEHKNEKYGKSTIEHGQSVSERVDRIFGDTVSG